MITCGEHSYYGTINNSLDVDIKIGKFSSIANGLTIAAGEHPPKFNKEVVSTYPFYEKWHEEDYPMCIASPVVIGSDVWIGENVTILGGVEIGDGAIIGAGSVVVKDVRGYTVVAGNPAEHLKYRFDIQNIVQLLHIRWWEWRDETIKKRLPDMVDIKTFIEKYGKKS